MFYCADFQFKHLSISAAEHFFSFKKSGIIKVMLKFLKHEEILRLIIISFIIIIRHFIILYHFLIYRISSYVGNGFDKFAFRHIVIIVQRRSS